MCRHEADVCLEFGRVNYVQAQMERPAIDRLKYPICKEFMESEEVRKWASKETFDV